MPNVLLIDLESMEKGSCKFFGFFPKTKVKINLYFKSIHVHNVYTIIKSTELNYVNHENTHDDNKVVRGQGHLFQFNFY